MSVSIPAKKDNRFLYNAVNLFENGDRARNHRQFGAHVWTPELESLYGAKKGEPLPDNPNLYTAYYDDVDIGRQASEYVIDKIWDYHDGDPYKFAQQYTGLPIESEVVQNYAFEIINRQKNKDKDNAVRRARNVMEIKDKKSQLLEEYPDGESEINKAMKDGRTPYLDLRKKLRKGRFGVDIKPVSDEEKDSVLDDNINAGFKTLSSSLAKMADYVLTSEDYLDRLPTTESVRSILRNDEKSVGNLVSPVLKKFAGRMDEDVEAMDAKYKEEFGKEFEVSDLGDPMFYKTKVARTLPNTLGLMLPSMGIARVVGGLKGVVAGVMASRPLESGMEALGLYEDLVAQGVDEDTAGVEASKLFNKNMGLILADAGQLALAMSGLPKPLRQVFGKYISTIGAVGTGALAEGAEEVVQNYFIKQGQASATGSPDPEFMESVLLASPQDKEAFALGALLGTGFTVAGQALSKAQVDNIVEEQYEEYLNLQQAKEIEDVAPINVEQEFFQDRVNNLSKHGDAIDIGFVDSEITNVFTEDELRSLGYFDFKEFQQSKLQKGDNGYVNDGIDRYELTIPATNYETGDSDAQRVLLSRSATTADFLEDTAEAVLRRLQTTNPQLAENIFGWIARVEEVADQYGVPLPYRGAELFSKSFVNNSLGYSDRGALPDVTVLPDALQDAFVMELETNDGGNLLDNMAIFGQQAEPVNAVEDYTPVEIATESPKEMYALGQKAQGGIFVMGGDAIARDAKGRRSVEGIRYPEMHSGWQLSEAGATAIENQAKAGNDVIIVYQYPSQSATESNPRFKEVFEREKKKNARRKKGNKKTLIQLRKDVERMVSEPDVNLNRGKVLYVAQFDKVLRGDERTVKHDTYPAQIVFKNVKELSRPFEITTLTDSIDPAVSRNAKTFVSSRDLRSRSANLYLAPSESPMVQELRAFAEGKQSVFDARMDSDKVMATFRRKGETTVEGVFESINSERELRYFGILADVAKDINLNGRHAQAGAVTNKFGKENSMVFTVENPDQNALDLYIAYAGLIGDQYQVMHFKPDNNGSDLVYETSFPITDQQGVIEISNNLNDIGIDHTLEIRGNTGKIIIIDLGDKIALDLQDKGVIDDTTTATRGSITFEGVEENESLSEKQNRKNSRDYWKSEVDRLEKEGYVSEAGKQAYRNLQSQLDKGEGFSLKSTPKDSAEFFNKKVSRKAMREIRRAERINNPKKLRDYYRSWSSQLRRAHDGMMNSIVKFQKRELDIKREYLKDAEPFIRVLTQAFKRANRKLSIRSDKQELARAFTDLSLALDNGVESDIIDILTNVDFFIKRDALNKYKQFRRTHERLHKLAFKSGLRLNYIDIHFPRVMTNHSAYLSETFGTLPFEQRSRLQKLYDRTSTEKGRDLSQEEKAEIANRYVRDLKGITNQSQSYKLKSRKIDTITREQLKYYAHPHEAIGMYIHNMSGLIAQSEFMGRGRDIYSIRPLKTKLNKKTYYGIYDKRIKEFVVGVDGKTIAKPNKNDPALMEEMESRIALDDFDMGDLSDMPLEDQVGMMMLQLENESGVIPRGKEERVRRLLISYFGMRQSGLAVRYVKNIGYATSMGSPSSAITQLADLGGAYYRSVEGQYANPIAVGRFLNSFVRALFNNSKIDLKQLGIENKLLEEVGEGSSLNTIFKYTGLKKMDRVGKETYINSVISRYKKDAKNFLKNKKTSKDAKFQARMEDKFSGNDLTQVIKDLADGKNTELVQLLAYSELLDVQPVAKSEVPVQYLDMPNGRVFYMLKTFMLKRIDFFGKEKRIALKQAKVLESQGKFAQAKSIRISRGYAPMIQLAIILTLAEAGADTLKDIMFGRKTTLTDLVVSNVLKLLLVSRYTFYNFAHDPLFAMFKAIAPPSDILSDPIRDVVYFGKHTWKERGDFEKALDKTKERGFRTPKNIPWIGKYIYWRKTNWLTGEESLGYGQKQIKKREKKGKRGSLSRSRASRPSR